MILLEPGNRVLGETVAAQIKAPEDTQNDDGATVKGARIPIDVKLCDFDDVMYHVVLAAETINKLRVSISLPFFRDIQDKGALDSVNKNFAGLIVDPEPSYDLTLEVDLDAGNHDGLATKIQNLKPLIVGGVFDSYFQALLDGKPLTESFHFNLRSDTTVYLVPKPDRVIVIYSLQFPDKVDAAIAKVFMQEFVDARRRLGSAPPCTFDKNPPLELKEFGITEPTGNLGFISFAVMKSHVDSGRKDKVVSVLQVFRNYLQYHLKCSKAYFHSRMRARVVSLLKILNRAKAERPDEKKEMKTISGKTFIRN